MGNINSYFLQTLNILYRVDNWQYEVQSLQIITEHVREILTKILQLILYTGLQFTVIQVIEQWFAQSNSMLE